jgi:hypothetical protein
MTHHETGTRGWAGEWFFNKNGKRQNWKVVFNLEVYNGVVHRGGGKKKHNGRGKGKCMHTISQRYPVGRKASQTGDSAFGFLFGLILAAGSSGVGSLFLSL